jgi:Domain of unknown function (DUF4349)
MNTDVGYLEDLGADLLQVAHREAILRLAPGLADAAEVPSARGRGRRAIGAGAGSGLRRMPSRRLIALAAAAFVALAGLVGYFVTRGGAPFGPRLELGAPAVRLQPRISRGAGAIASPGPVDFAPASGEGLLTSQPGTSGGVGAPPARPIPDAGQLIVKTADLSVEVPKGRFPEAFDRATAIAGPLGGFVSSSSSVGTGTRSGALTIRVPATAFDRALAALRALGRVGSQSIAGQDVTTQYVDLTARLRTWESQETALLRLMAKAQSVSDTLRVQGELQRVQLTIEQLKGQIRVLNDRTSNATLTVQISEPRAKPTPVVNRSVQNPSIATALKRSIAGVLNVVVAVVVGLGYLVPIALLAMVAWLVVRRTRRRRYAAA